MTATDAQKQLMYIFDQYSRGRSVSDASYETIAMAITALSCMECPHKNTVL